jgi:hypothetical protein
MAPLLPFVSVFVLSRLSAITLDFRKDRTDSIFMTRDESTPNSKGSSGWATCLLLDSNSRIMTNRPHLRLELFMHTFVPCPQFFCLLKPVAHVCTPTMVEDGLSAFSASSHGMS